MVKVNGVEAYTLFDTGSTLDTINLDFARATHIPQYALKQVLNLQLGMQGSRSRVMAGARVELTTPGLTLSRYFVDISNIAKYQMILGTPFFRRYKVCCNFSDNTITFGDKIIHCLPMIEDEIEAQRVPRKFPEKAEQLASMNVEVASPIDSELPSKLPIPTPIP